MAPNKAELMMEALMAFNRKERYHLICEAVIGGQMQLNEGFRKSLKEESGIEIPVDAFVAMDYHLDWISAAVQLATNNISAQDAAQSSEDFSNRLSGSDDVLSGNQEDVDLLVAFLSGKKIYLILVEAKADSGWTSKQLKSESKRLKAILNDTVGEWIDPRLVLIGAPRRDNGSPNFNGGVLKQCPDWFFKGRDRGEGLPYMEMRPARQLYAPTRTNKVSEESKEYGNWRLNTVRGFAPENNDE